MKIEEIRDKLMFYVGFLERFTKHANGVLKNSDLKHLALAREYILEAHKALEKKKRRIDCMPCSHFNRWSDSCPFCHYEYDKETDCEQRVDAGVGKNEEKRY